MDSRMKFRWISALTILSVAIATIYVTKAFITTILWGVFAAYLLHPLYLYILRITKNKQIASLLSIFLVFLVFMAIILGAVGAVATEVSNLSVSQYDLRDIVNNFSSFANSFVGDRIPGSAGYIEEASKELEDLATQILPKLIPIATDTVTGLAANMPIYLAQFGVSVLLVYYVPLRTETDLPQPLQRLFHHMRVDRRHCDDRIHPARDLVPVPVGCCHSRLCATPSRRDEHDHSTHGALLSGDSGL